VVAVLVSPGDSHPPGVQCQGVPVYQDAQEQGALDTPVRQGALSLAMHY